MEQRRLRLGDILDDYCPRERRVTNHAIVAMVEDDIKQTRCTTCDAEHAYKEAKVPKRRKKEAPALYKQVLAGMPEIDAPVLAAPAIVAPADIAIPLDTPLPPVAAAAPVPEHDSDEETDDLDLNPLLSADRGEFADAGDDERYEPDSESMPRPDEGPVHRPLIRATLPRPEGAQKDARPVPEFTIRQNNGRGNGANHYRGDRMRMRGNGEGQGRPPRGGNNPNANGNRAQAGPRFGRAGRGGGAQANFRGGQRHGGKKGRG